MQTENEEVLVTNILDARSDKPRPRSPAPNFWIGPSRRHVRTCRDELLVRSGASDPQPLPGAERERPDAIAPSHRPGIGVGRNVVLPDPVRRPQARGPVPESRVGGGEEGPDGLRPRILPRRVVLERALVRLLRIARPRLLRHLLQGAGKKRRAPGRVRGGHARGARGRRHRLLRIPRHPPCARGAFLRGTRGATGDVSAKSAGARRARTRRVRAADGQRSDGAKISREELHRQR